MSEITANSNDGRVLLALRAGPMAAAELYERQPAFSPAALMRRGLIERLGEDCYRITAAGRAACPLRNPLAATLAPAPIAATGTRPIKTDVLETKEVVVRNHKQAQGPSDQVRALLQRHPEGLARKEIIRQTELSEARVDNAIANLIRVGEAQRTGYGHIAPSTGLKCIEAAIVAPVADAAADRCADVGKTLETDPPAAPPAGDAGETESITVTAPAAPVEIEFAVYSDGRLAIFDGDEILILPPDATRRLGYFLGCLETHVWPPRLDPSRIPA